MTSLQIRQYGRLLWSTKLSKVSGKIERFVKCGVGDHIVYNSLPTSICTCLFVQLFWANDTEMTIIFHRLKGTRLGPAHSMPLIQALQMNTVLADLE